MTIGGWLAARSATVPANLVECMREALGPELDRDVADAPECCVAAAERLVAGLLSVNSTGRGSALTLLAADALVTYAFEAAADAPDTLPARATTAMQTLATLT